MPDNATSTSSPSAHRPSPLSLDDMRLFCRVARLGSLSAVARERNVPVSQISRMLQRLEANYGVRLVHRSTHGLSLTAEGERFHTSAERVVQELDEMDAELQGKTQTVSGLVRVAVSAMMADHLLVPSLASLITRHPALRIDLRVDDKVVDMAQEGIDIAIRTGEPTSDLWVMRRLGQLNRRLYASPGYIAQHGMPTCAKDLGAHRLITHSAQAALNRWMLGSEAAPHSVPAQGQFLSDNSATQATMALAGLGNCTHAVIGGCASGGAGTAGGGEAGMERPGHAARQRGDAGPTPPPAESARLHRPLGAVVRAVA